MKLNCLNIQHILVLIKYTEISNIKTFKLIKFLTKITTIKKSRGAYKWVVGSNHHT